jgi:hypothetical protein
MSMVSREGPPVLAMKGMRRARWSAAMLLIRSHKQHPSTTCNLSVDGADPWVRVRGCSRSSVAVDVPTDVDREAFGSRPLTDGVPAAKHSDSWSGRFPASLAIQKSILIVVVVAWASPVVIS